MCFCEKWLTPTQASPQLREGHTVLRCDRTIENNHGGMQHLLTVLISVFNTLDFSLPSIVLGDFNEDFSPLALNEPDTTRLGRFMRDNSYNHLVKKYTTDRGTLIDHIYFIRTAGEIDTKVCDCYYSDHDVVLCTVPLQ